MFRIAEGIMPDGFDRVVQEQIAFEAACLDLARVVPVPIVDVMQRVNQRAIMTGIAWRDLVAEQKRRAGLGYASTWLLEGEMYYE